MVRVKKYLMAGLDFIFGKDGKLYFIEANGTPGGMRFLKELYGRDTAEKAILKLLKEKSPRKEAEICIFIRRRWYPGEGKWLYDVLRKVFPNVHICFLEDQVSPEFAISSLGKKVFPEVVLFNHLALHPLTERAEVVINPEVVLRVVKDKDLTRRVVKRAGIETPQTYLGFREDFGILLKILKSSNFLMKPNFGAEGRGIYFELSKKIAVPETYLFQEIIDVELLDGKFWDIRSFVVDGKYIGSFIRVSKERVTNIHQGGRVLPIPKEIERDIKRTSLKVVRAIDRFCVYLSGV